jgi:hypothetical protein
MLLEVHHHHNPNHHHHHHHLTHQSPSPLSADPVVVRTKYLSITNPTSYIRSNQLGWCNVTHRKLFLF